VRDGVVIVEREGDGTRTHGERLPRELMAVLDAAGATLHDVDRFAVCTGPGSFTGLRVGIATMQGLALAQHKLIVPVSAFEAMASDVPRSSTLDPRSSEPIAIWIDAHRGEVFAVLYSADGRTMLHEPTSLAPAETLDAWIATGALTADAAVHFAGDGALRYEDVIRERLADPRLPHSPRPLAGTIATIAGAEPARGVSPHAVAPLYIRRPDAELARDRRSSPKAPQGQP
jgi:tRNA threonylcarbamoyladenosine biosynthesis protein TsaB